MTCQKLPGGDLVRMLGIPRRDIARDHLHQSKRVTGPSRTAGARYHAAFRLSTADRAGLAAAFVPDDTEHQVDGDPPGLL